jgi:hypothetical protein
MDYKQRVRHRSFLSRVNKKQNDLSQAVAKGNILNMLASLSLGLWRDWLYLLLAFFVKNNFYKKELIKIKKIATNVKSQTLYKVDFENIINIYLTYWTRVYSIYYKILLL